MQGWIERESNFEYVQFSFHDIKLLLFIRQTLTFIHIQSVLKSVRNVTRGDRNLLNRWSHLSCKDETRFRYPCYRRDPPWQFIRCSILDISPSNSLELSRSGEFLLLFRPTAIIYFQSITARSEPVIRFNKIIFQKKCIHNLLELENWDNHHWNKI